MDILEEHISAKPAMRGGLFNLQCKYLSISVARASGVVGTEEEAQWRSLSSFSFLLLLFEKGKRFEQLSCVP